MSDYFIEAPCHTTDEDGNYLPRAYYHVPRAVFDEYWLYRRQNKIKAELLKELHDWSRGCLVGIEEKPSRAFDKINKMVDLLEEYFNP